MRYECDRAARSRLDLLATSRLTSVDEKLDELAEKLREGMGPHEFEKLFSQVWTEESRPESIRLSVASGSGSSGRRGSVRS